MSDDGGPIEARGNVSEGADVPPAPKGGSAHQRTPERRQRTTGGPPLDLAVAGAYPLLFRGRNIRRSPSRR